MTTLTSMSRKQRQRAARLWTEWRRAGEPPVITFARAFKLTGMGRYMLTPEKKVRLTAVAIDYTRWRERT